MWQAATICPRLAVDRDVTLKVVRVTCDVVYLCANFSFPRPLCSGFRSNVSDRQMSDAHHRLMPPLARHNNISLLMLSQCLMTYV